MKALVTGANGLIGAHLVRELLAHGCEVAALVRETSDTSALEGLPVDLHHADVTSPDATALAAAAQDCSLVFHTAMHFTYDRSRDSALDEAATRGTEHVLRAAHGAGATRVVVTSSSVVFGYGRPGEVRDETSPLSEEGGGSGYVAAKLRQDTGALALGRTLGLDVVVVCPTLTVGPHATTLGPSNGAIVAYLADPARLTYPGGCNIVAAADVAAGHWLAAQHGGAGERYLLGAENLEWPALHALIAELAGVDPPRGVLNHGLAYLAAGAEELRARVGGRAALVTRAQAEMVGRYYWYSHAKAANLGYQPRPARQALAEAISWLAMSRHVSRELRASLRLHDDVHALRTYAEGPA
jgi:dihydroflavonol-4-reductase